MVLMGEHGFTFTIAAGGEAYLNLSVGGGLALNASVSVRLHIRNLSLEKVTVKPQVFAGVGTR